MGLLRASERAPSGACAAQRPSPSIGRMKGNAFLSTMRNMSGPVKCSNRDRRRLAWASPRSSLHSGKNAALDRLAERGGLTLSSSSCISRRLMRMRDEVSDLLDHLQEVGESARPEVVPDPAMWLRNSPISIRASCSGPLRHLCPQLLRFYASIGDSLDRSDGCFPAVMMSVRSYDEICSRQK